MTFFADLLLVVTGGLGVAIAVAAWRNRPRAGSVPLAGLMVTITVWSVTHLLEHYATGGLQVGLERLNFTALAPAAFLWFAFALECTGYRNRLTRRALALLCAWPVMIGVLVWVPESAGSLIAIWPEIEAEQGFVFWGHVGVSYGLLAAGTVLLVRHVRRSVGLFRRQGAAVLAGITVAWGGSAVAVFELLGDVHLHALPLGFVLMGGFLLWAIAGPGLTRVAPIARRTIVRTLEAGVVSVDEDGHVTSANPAARELFGLEGTVVGRPVTAAFEDHPELGDWLRTFDPASGPSEATFDVDGTIVECELTPLHDDEDRPVGGVLLLYDVTEQRRRHERLERQKERLEQFGSVLSHDLRNPLNVALGHIEIARQERDSDHLTTAVEALERMETLIGNMRTLTRQGQSVEETDRVRLSSLAEGSWQVVETPDADLVVESDLAFDADADRLSQLFENLFRNSVEHGSTGSRTPSGDSVEHGSTGSRASPDDSVEHGSTGSRTPSGDGAGSDGGAGTGESRPADRSDAEQEDGGSGVSVRVGAIGEDGFYVEDDGPGIPESERVAVFETGYSTATEGTGLGLAIVSEGIEAHGWEIRAVEGRSGGARFEVTGIESADRTDASPEPAASSGEDQTGRAP